MYIACDIGGTKTRIACVDAQGLQSDPITMVTQRLYADGVREIRQAVTTLVGDTILQGIVIGIAGSLLHDRSVVYNAPHLPDWAGKPLRDELAKVYNAPVYLENDAALVGLGEAVYGAGKGNDIVAYVACGTGIGGARIVDGKLDATSMGFEPGHHIIAMPDTSTKAAPTCPTCNTSGHWEAFIGGAALEYVYSKRPEELRDPQTRDTIARHTALGLYNLMTFWSPDIIVIGGGLVNHEVIALDAVRKYIASFNQIYPNVPTVVQSELEDIGGLYGCVAYIRSLT